MAPPMRLSAPPPKPGLRCVLVAGFGVSSSFLHQVVLPVPHHPVWGVLLTGPLPGKCPTSVASWWASVSLLLVFHPLPVSNLSPPLVCVYKHADASLPVLFLAGMGGIPFSFYKICAFQVWL